MTRQRETIVAPAPKIKRRIGVWPTRTEQNKKTTYRRRPRFQRRPGEPNEISHD